jgi:hypothetical protein
MCDVPREKLMIRRPVDVTVIPGHELYAPFDRTVVAVATVGPTLKGGT